MAKTAKTNTTGTRGRTKMTDEQKAAKAAEREAFKTMTPEQKNAVRAANFSRLGTPRINAAVATIRRLGNLAGTNYRYTETQVNTIRKALTEAVNDTMARFEKTGATDRPAITL